MNILQQRTLNPCAKNRNGKKNSTSCNDNTQGSSYYYSPIRTSSSLPVSFSFSSRSRSYRTCLLSITCIIISVLSFLHVMNQVQPLLNAKDHRNKTVVQQSVRPPSLSSSSSSSSLPSLEQQEIEQQKLLNYTHNNRNSKQCTFQKPYSEAPIPLILMALGRAGSSVTWNTLSTLLGSTTTAYEITGGNKTKSLNFFNSLQQGQEEQSGDMDTNAGGVGVGVNWAVERLCATQRYNLEHVEDPVITGFQWKPYRVTLNHEFGKGALEVLGKYNPHNRTRNNITNSSITDGKGKDDENIIDVDADDRPNIKVLFLSRNPLDRLISNIRHRGYIRSDEIPAHCAIDDKGCVERHRAHSKGTVLPVGKELIHSMKSGLQIDRLSRTYLEQYGVDHLNVRYENLFNGNGNVTEWVRIFDFLGRGPKDVVDYRDNLTMEDIQRAFAMAPTSSKRHRDTIANYDEVEETLIGAGLGRLLH